MSREIARRRQPFTRAQATGQYCRAQLVVELPSQSFPGSLSAVKGDEEINAAFLNQWSAHLCATGAFEWANVSDIVAHSAACFNG